jgi:hypothetical protein
MLRLSVVSPRLEGTSVSAKRTVGRYTILAELAHGGMATVYYGRLLGAVGFSRSVAVKQLHPQYARSPEFVAQFLDEAQLTARIRHPNVVSVLDVVTRRGELFVVMEYVPGEPLSRLVRFAGEPLPIEIASAVLMHVLLGLHAAHEATTEHGERLEIVHRDVSPQNILVGVDGESHILDFGIAKAATRLHSTESGQIKGKLAYMAPEQLNNLAIDRRADVFAAGIVLWELLTGQRLFGRGDHAATLTAALECSVRRPSELRAGIAPELDEVVLKALARSTADRFATARDMAIALEAAAAPASALTVGAWLEKVAGASLRERSLRLREAEENPGAHALLDVDGLQRQLASPLAAPDGTSPTVVGSPPDAKMPSQVGRRRAISVWLVPSIAAACLALLAISALRVRDMPKAELPAAGVQAPLILEASPNSSVAEASPPVTLVSDLPQEEVPAVASFRPSRKLKAPKGKCTFPYLLDSEGRKRFKPECF